MSWGKAASNKPYNEKRARKRLPYVRQDYGRNKYVVEGMGRDALGEYPVEVKGDDLGEWWCKCQDLQGGRYRPVCTHKGAVELYRDGERAEPEGVDTQPPSNTQQERPEPVSPVKPESFSDPLGIVPEPVDPRWGSEPLPDWIEAFRPHQEKAIKRVERAFQDNNVKVVFLDAPTGSGKTLIAECARRLAKGEAVYTCSTKTLQEQFLKDYPYSKVLKGRSNYSAVSRWGAKSCAECRCKPSEWCNNMDMCNHMEQPCPDDPCSYRAAKWEARWSDIAVINTAYMLAEMNYVGNMSGRDLCIIDECDLIENSLMSFVEVRVSKKWQKKLGLPTPNVKTATAKSAREDWQDWSRDVLGKVRSRMGVLENQIAGADRERRSYLEEQLEKLEGLATNVQRLSNDLHSDDEDVTQWVYTGYEDADEGETHPIIFKPVTVDKHAPKVLWPHAKRFLMMSASIISPALMAESLGLRDEQWDVVYVPSTFPVENRPIYVSPLADVTSKNRDKAYPRLTRAVRGVANSHPDERILVHTVSYRLTWHLLRNLGSQLDKSGDVRHTGFNGRRVIAYVNSNGRDAALQEYQQTPGSILLAPSLDRGTDLPGELCRVQVICKVPFPYLGDKQVSARLYGTSSGQTWYDIQAVRTMVQMTGRAVRSSSDHATTYILDRQFKRLFRQNKAYFPDWWKEALDWSGETKKRLLKAA